MKYFFAAIACAFAFLVSAQQQHYLLVGTYTNGKSKGVYVYRFLPNGKALLLDSAETPNPSYLAVSPSQKFVYAVNELGADEGGGSVTAFRFDAQRGKLAMLNSTPAMGEHPCYISIDNTGRWAVVGNYTGGNVAVLPIEKDGRVGNAVTTVQHHGKGFTDRQEKPHVHATVLSRDNRTLFVPDLGIDKLMIYAFNPVTGSLAPKDSLQASEKGGGPRHFEIHPSSKWAYLLQELSGKVTVYRHTNGRLQPVQNISMVPRNFGGSFTGADIHVSPDGRFLYTSVRDESNTIAIFRINPSSGRLTLVGHQSTRGKTPRNFSLDPSGKFLMVANQRSDEVVVFRVNRKTGLLTDTGNRLSVGSPVCLKWITK